MSQSDPFALKNSGLNDFLFAEVGSEMNGSPLTILSMLARLGTDPWAEAARLAGLPKSSIVDALAKCICQMPLCPQALTDARGTAARLILLLPSQVQSGRIRASLPVAKSALPAWVPLAAFLSVLAFGVMFQMMAPATTPAAFSSLAKQAIAHPQAPSN
jgi:hypothetical protein